MAYLYRHIRLDKNEVFYIGIGVGRRAWQKYHRNRHWLAIVDKFPYEVEIILDELTWEDAIEKEKEFIKLYGRRDLGAGTLVNLTDGGEGMLGFVPTRETRARQSIQRIGIAPRPAGWKMTEEGKRKMSLFHKGHKRCVGRVLSDETKSKIANSLKGNPPTNNKLVLMYSYRGMFICEYESANEAQRMTGQLASNITAACRRRSNPAGAIHPFVWRYKTECVDEFGEIITKIQVPYHKYNQKRRSVFATALDEWNYRRGALNYDTMPENFKINGEV